MAQPGERGMTTTSLGDGGAPINDLVGIVFAPVAETMQDEGWDIRQQASFWQALARDAMLRSLAAIRAEREAKAKPVRGAPNDG
jgi:hypothetical protein